MDTTTTIMPTDCDCESCQEYDEMDARAAALPLLCESGDTYIDYDGHRAYADCLTPARIVIHYMDTFPYGDGGPTQIHVCTAHAPAIRLDVAQHR